MLPLHMSKKSGSKMPSKLNKNHVKSDLDEPISEDEDEYANESDENQEEMDDSFEEEIQETVSEKKRRKVSDEIVDEAPRKKKKLENDFYKPPTVEELNQLRETENLFHSNLFRLQIEEMLNEMKIKNKYKKQYDTWFAKLKGSIEAIEDTEPIKITGDMTEFNEKLSIRVPIPRLAVETKASFRFLKPSTIETIGSYAYDATAGPTITIDIVVEMPSAMFQKYDYQNYRYLRKKAIYLAYIAANIPNDIVERKNFIGDSMRPMLRIIPSGKLGTKIAVHLHVSAEESSFKLNRFSPEKNSVRAEWYYDRVTPTDNLPPTPHYNSIVLRDLLMLKTNTECVKIVKEYPNVRDGIILLKIWLIQRDLIKGYEGFSGHIVTMLVLYLLSIKKLNTFMSSYQIVRNVWSHLVHVSWAETGIAMNPDYLERVEEYKKYYDCVFLDSTGYHNIAAYLTNATFSWVQREAEVCLQHLESVHADSFQTLFMRKVPFYKAFDHLICIKPTEDFKKIVPKKTSRKDRLNYGPNKRALSIKLLYQLLKEGLTNRVNRICILPLDYKEWDCITGNGMIAAYPIVTGLELNPENCFGIVDKGPEANLPEAAKFRSFWENKSDLRRFQDGSIREAVVWSKGKTLAGRRVICKKIVQFLLEQKLSLSRKTFSYVADQVESLLKLKKVVTTHLPYGTGEEASLKVIRTFDALEKELMSLTDVPLAIHGVQGSSPVFRYTDVFPPLATNIRSTKGLTKYVENYLVLGREIDSVPRYTPALEVSLQLSTSGKWPDELEAVRKTKAAFHTQIAERLRKQYSLRAQGNYAHIDVMKDGFVFRLRVAHQKEIALLKQEVDEKGVIKYRDNEESRELERKLFDLPKLNSALHGLHSQQPSFGAACCLTKRWLSAQLLDNFHIPDVAVELLVASMYLVPAPYKSPQTPQVAFLRLLDIFARGHWNTDPIIVNFNNEMSREEIVAVETLFGSSRSTLPPLFISTPYDQQNSIWTKKTPTTIILNRISALAKESLKIFEKNLYTTGLVNVKAMFRPPLSEYHCLIRLKPSMIARKLQAVDVPEEEPILDLHPYKHHEGQKIPVLDFDPVQCYLKELRNNYDEFALFFHDTYGGAVIGVLLKPSALEPKDFKVSNVNCCKYDTSGKLVLNISTMIQDFEILGKGLVESIDVISSKLDLS